MQLLEKVLVAFVLLQALRVVVMYLLDPSLFLRKLSLGPSSANRSPWAMTRLGVAVVGVSLVVLAGVIGQGRWLFWRLLLLFGANGLGWLLATVRPFAGGVPTPALLWSAL
jgi:hypothetical protein